MMDKVGAMLCRICAITMLVVFLGAVALAFGWRIVGPPYCRKCGYNLADVAEPVCPGCGTACNNRNVAGLLPKTSLPVQAVGWGLYLLGGGILLCIGVMILLMVIL